jgi:hypothetical protein
MLLFIPMPSSNARPWYREPGSFIAIAALIVSVTAVAVGIYEAALQRRHDRAEVWPRLELQTFVSDDGAVLRVENTGLGPALVRYVSVKVDGKPERSWPAAMHDLFGGPPPPFSTSTVFGHAVRPGDRTIVAGLPPNAVPPNYFKWIGRVAMQVCYASVFDDEYWMVSDTFGKSSVWHQVSSCPNQSPDADL